MTKSTRNILLIMTTLVIGAFVSKLWWDDYQFDRALEQSPNVVALIDQIRPFPGSSRVESGDEGPSTNEYSTAVRRHFVSDETCSDVWAHLDIEASRNGFTFHSVAHPHNRLEVFHRKGEYEIRSQFQSQDKNGCAYAVSVNWYGLDR